MSAPARLLFPGASVYARHLCRSGPPRRLWQPRRRSPFQPSRSYNTGAPGSDSDAQHPGGSSILERAVRISLAPLNGHVELQCTQCDADGGATTTTLSKADMARAYGLAARDLQAIDLPSQGFPHILVRASTILVHMFDLRLLIQAERLLLLHVDGLADTTISRVFTYDLQNKLRSGGGGGGGAHHKTSASFELRALEAALAAVAAGLEAAYLAARADVRAALQHLDAQMAGDEETTASAHTGLRTLLDVARRLADIEQRARLARGALETLLREDRDMADLYLSDAVRGARRAADDHDEAEYLLEAYFRAHDAVVSEAAALMADVHRTADTVRSVLASRRNQIMLLETKVEIAMLGMAAATLVAGWYGMNTVNFVEESLSAFVVVVTGSVFGGGVISMVLLRRLRNIRRKKI